MRKEALGVVMAGSQGLRELLAPPMDQQEKWELEDTLLLTNLRRGHSLFYIELPPAAAQ